MLFYVYSYDFTLLGHAFLCILYDFTFSIKSYLAFVFRVYFVTLYWHLQSLMCRLTEMFNTILLSLCFSCILRYFILALTELDVQADGNV
jgi:hypothetical protein